MIFRSISAIALMVIATNIFSQQKTTINWGQQVVINNVPVFADAGKVAEAGGTNGREHGLYGSQYARLLKMTNGVWLAAYTVSRNNGYAKDTAGGLELEVAQSNDNGQHWTPVSVITDHGRDLDNAEMIQCKDCLLYTSDAADERSSVDLG